MQLLAVDSPRILPDSVSSYSVRLIDGSRSDHFSTGRHCARAAIARLGVPEPLEIPRGAGGEPVWPEGVTGSISHKDDFFWAAAARRTDLRSLGIDVEWMIETTRAAGIAKTVVRPDERSVGGAGIDQALRVILLFSIKEAVFKCLYPIVRTRFYYDALRVTSIDREEGAFSGELTTALSSEFAQGSVLSGHFAIDGPRVASAIWMPASA